MIIQYNIVVTIVNLLDNSTYKFDKIFETEITATDDLLYNNYHVLSEGVYILDMFEDELDTYCIELGIEKSSIEIDEFEIVSLTDRSDVFFESEDEDNTSLSLKPIIKCYVYPKNDALQIPKLTGIAYDSTTIIWSWPEDEQYAHYLVEEAIDPNSESANDKIIAQIPIGVTSYTETGLNPDTPYTRRLINYTDEQTSTPSASVTVMTEPTQISKSLEEYDIPKNYDFTTNENDKNIIEENLTAFHSGVGDGNDLKVYKQMDADFYQKFKTYFEITGRRIQKEKRYDQVGFNYKICLEAEETIEEQEAEVTFDINVFPREWVAIEDYMWATHPVEVKTRLTATVFLRKEQSIDGQENATILVPKIEIEPVYETFTKKTAVIISIDMSSSMNDEIKSGTNKGKRRYQLTQAAACKLVDKIHEKAKKPSVSDKLIQYVIIGWAQDAYYYYNGYSPSEAKTKIKQIKYRSTENNGYTNWYTGLTGAFKKSGYIHSDREVVGQIFFTDGFVNQDENNNFARYASDSDATSVINSIKKAADYLKNKDCETYFIFGNGVNNIDSEYIKYRQESIDFARDKILPAARKNFEHVYYPQANGQDNHKATMDSVSEDTLASVLIKGLKVFKQVQVGTIEKFVDWEEVPDTTNKVSIATIDEIKAVTITSDILTYTFDNNVTPVEYSRDEKRAIIPSYNILSATKLSDKSVYDIIMNKVKQTDDYKNGFKYTIGTVESNGESDSFLIKGLQIQNTYKYADNTEITEDNWQESTWENGMSGTVNTFTDINKIKSETYNDDCYLVSKDNYVKIQGYAEAIIYDNTRFVITELNGYDHSSEILVSASTVYDNLLTNRKKPSLKYSDVNGSDYLSHTIDIIQRDTDIVLSGYDELFKAGDYLTIAPLTNDLIAYNTTRYDSPVLNYRFNLEDPDAKTPIYEILPDCNPESNFLHIVLLHVYYAKNVYITNESNYIEQYGDDPNATNSSNYIPLTEGLFKWTLKEWRDGVNNENGWYIDNYIWFMGKKIEKRQKYYDELPGPGIDTFYGMVNGRYRSDNQTGKQDLRVDTAQFNIPTTVHPETINIYIIITEFHPDTALVSYKWDNPLNNKDGITQVNGDYVTFTSDNLSYKDIEYYDIISTINMEAQELFDKKNVQVNYEILKPITTYQYINYYLNVVTDNSDVLAMHYPSELIFDENDLVNIGVTYKGVVNATSKWSPRIHNGYYYLNQHEYFAYTEFDVEANFDTLEELSYKTISGYVSFDVQLRRKAPEPKIYKITKDTRSELLQDENNFTWVSDKGITLKPFIDGIYYKEYLTYMYISPIILFENALTKADAIHVNYSFDDNSELLNMEVRSYDIENGKWSDWVPFFNDTIPNTPLSSAYQLRIQMQPSVQNEDYFVEDYLCCYLDWKDDMDEPNITNIVTITDHMTTGPDEGKGIYISKILDYGCLSDIKLSIFESNYKERIRLFISYTNDNVDTLLLENITWHEITDSQSMSINARYFRYKIVIPEGEKLYWLHKEIQTLKTTAILPYIESISMAGTYAPADLVVNFVNTESFEILKNGQNQVIFNSIIDIIGADIIEKGFLETEIESVSIQCTTEDVEIKYNANIANKYPLEYLNSPIYAKSDIDTEIIIKNTPYIFVERDELDEHDIIKIIGTPQQYCPITVEDENEISYTQLYTKDFRQTETYVLTERTKYLELKSNRYDEDFHVYIDDEELDTDKYKVINHLVIFNDFVELGHTIKIEYCLLYSFIAEIDRNNNTTILYLHPGKNIPVPEKCKVYFETNTKNNKFIAHDISLNPIYRTDYKGFIYLTDEHNEPYKINIYCNPLRIKAGGFDKIDVLIEVLDIKENPVVSKKIAVDCEYGILNCDNYETDINGVIHLIYESAYSKCTDKLTARTLTDDSSIIEQSITIINE